MDNMISHDPPTGTVSAPTGSQELSTGGGEPCHGPCGGRGGPEQQPKVTGMLGKGNHSQDECYELLQLS